MLWEVKPDAIQVMWVSFCRFSFAREKRKEVPFTGIPLRVGFTVRGVCH